MTDFGTRLKQAREQRGISQRQIAAATKISMAALEALERNDFSRLPGGIFSRAFVRAYALEVGLDPEQTVQDFLVEYEQNYSARVEKPPPEITPDDRLFLEKQQRAARWLRAASIALVLVLVAAFVGWRVVSSRRAAVGPNATSSNEAVATPAPDPAPAAPPPQAAQEELAPPVVDAAPPDTAAAPAAAAIDVPADQVALHLQITSDCWVRVTVDGTLAFEQILTKGDSRDIRPGREVHLQVGNAGAVQWSINGQPAKELGKPGQTASVRVTRATLSRFVGS